MCLDYVFFFFSSRRRHTRYWRDWSSDVCSSDLKAEHGSDYFDDLHRVHDSLGLGIPAEEGVRAFASLSPVKEKELVVVGQKAQNDSRSEEHTSELQSRQYLVCRLLLEKKKKKQ